MCVPRAASCAASGGATGATRAVTPPIRGSILLSSLSSSLYDWCEFRELAHMADEARQRYSNTTLEVGQLEHCLDTVMVALEAMEMETATA